LTKAFVEKGLKGESETSVSLFVKLNIFNESGIFIGFLFSLLNSSFKTKELKTNKRSPTGKEFFLIIGISENSYE
jgi:hypothetical protein